MASISHRRWAVDDFWGCTFAEKVVPVLAKLPSRWRWVRGRRLGVSLGLLTAFHARFAALAVQLSG